MNGRKTPFENGPELEESHRLRPATVADVTYDEPAQAPQLRPRVTGTLGGGSAAPRPAQKAPQVQLDWDEESDTKVMGPNHIAPGKAPDGASLELDWDNDDSNTEKWQPRHVSPPRKVQPRTTSGVRPAVQVQPAQPLVPTAPEDVIEELREQLIEVLERARTSEARAVAAERRAEESDKGRSAMAALRNQLSTSIERARSSEAAHAVAERRAQENEQEAQEALQRLSEQLMFAHEQVEANESHVHDAAQRAALAEQTVQHARAERQLVEETMARALRRASARSSVLFGLSVVLLLGCAAAAYVVLYAPMQQRMAAQQALQVQEASRHGQELASLQARFDAEHQEFDATRRQLESQLSAAGMAGAGKSQLQAPAAATHADKPAPTARADKPAAETKQTISAARAAPRRGQHAKAADAAEADAPADEPKHESKPEKPAASERSSGSADRDNDPLDGL